RCSPPAPTPAAPAPGSAASQPQGAGPPLGPRPRAIPTPARRPRGSRVRASSATRTAAGRAARRRFDSRLDRMNFAPVFLAVEHVPLRDEDRLGQFQLVVQLARIE